MAGDQVDDTASAALHALPRGRRTGAGPLAGRDPGRARPSPGGPYGKVDRV